MNCQIVSDNTVSLILILAHLLSFLLFVPFFLPLWIYVLIFVILSVSLLIALQRTGALHLHLPAPMSWRFAAIGEFRWDSNGVWRLWTRDGRQYEAELQPGSAVYSWLVVLNFNTLAGDTKARRFSVLLTPRQLPRDEFRRLRVRLALEAGRLKGDSAE